MRFYSVEQAPARLNRSELDGRLIDYAAIRQAEVLVKKPPRASRVQIESELDSQIS